MKTSDLELRAGADKTSHGGFAGLFDWLLPKKPAKAKGKYKLGTPPAAPGPDGKTRISQTIPDVVGLLVADRASRVAVHGDAAFYQAFRAEADGIACFWVSTDIMTDQPNGARPATGDAFKDCDAVVVGGADTATNFRYSLRMALAHAPTTPVHWVADNWEFCAGTAAVPLEIEDVDALVFNHFEEFFAIRDPLQFRFEIIAEGETRRSYRVLGPSESVNLNLKSLMPDRQGAVCIKVHVAHPYLTRGRHYRFRVCGDVFWKDSFAIIHGSHQFFKNVDKIQQFRLIDSVIRKGRVVMTVPNYALDMGGDDEVIIGSGAVKTVQKRSRKRPVEEVRFERQHASTDSRQYFAASYAGYGTSFWYALEDSFSTKPGKIGSIAANHLCRVGVDNRADIAFTPDERAIVETAIKAGYMIHPRCMPVLHGAHDLAFGFNFDASNPPFDDYWLRFYARDGSFLGDMRYHKDFIGPAFIEDVLNAWPGSEKSKVRMALVCPDFLKIDLAPQRLVTTADLVVRHAETGDQDVTEFQPSWRNLGAIIPTLPHWLHPSIGVMGRSNVIGRVRTKDGYRTGVFLGNASGNLNYDMSARAEIAILNHRGARLSHFVTLPAFGAELVWLDDVVPGLSDHVGESGIAALQVKCADADLTAHVIGLSPNGAVGLQHLWGY
jgi:hypothetical protein